MKNENTQIIITNEFNNVVGEIGVKNNLLHGLCIWYNNEQNPISCGLFNEGKPYTGTFLNWAKFIENWEGEDYNKNLYCKDWVTMFEMSFISEQKSYQSILEIYVNEVQLKLN